METVKRGVRVYLVYWRYGRKHGPGPRGGWYLDTIERRRRDAIREIKRHRRDHCEALAFRVVLPIHARIDAEAKLDNCVLAGAPRRLCRKCRKRPPEKFGYCRRCLRELE